MPQLSHDLLRWWPLVLAYLVAAPAAWYTGRRLLPPQRWRAVPWTAPEAVAAFISYYLWGTFLFLLLIQTGLAERLYGPNAVAAVKAADGDRVAQMRVGLLATALALPFQVWTILAILRFGSDTRPYQLGLTTRRAGRNVILGALGWLILTPPVLLLYALASWLQNQLARGGVKEHPLSRLATDPNLTSAEVALVVLVAMVTAPVLEELIFRGVLQRWFERSWWGGHVAMGLALAWSVLNVAGEVGGDAWHERLLALAPVLFCVLMIPGFVWLSQWQRSPANAALYGTSLLFAVAHTSAWPSPIPLFVLALGLGWLARRTQSLVGPMVLHGLFNGVAVVQLLVLRNGLG